MPQENWRVRIPSPERPHSVEVIGPDGNWTIRCTESKSGARRGESPTWYGWKDEIKDAHKIAAAPKGYELAKHILGMDGDPYLNGHPEWPEIVNEARAIFGMIRDAEFDSILRTASEATA